MAAQRKQPEAGKGHGPRAGQGLLTPRYAQAWPCLGFGRGFRGRGFTLIELMTVIAIIAIVAAMIFPAIGALTKSNRVEAGMNTLSVAVAAGRALATQAVTFTRDLDPAREGVQTAQPPAGPGYRGVALLFTPSNEIRLVRHTDWAWDGSSPPEALAFKKPPRCAYEDVPNWDYIKLPSGVGMVGLTRGGNSNDPHLIVLPPPFAVRFEREGKVVNGRPSSTPEHVVFYNGDYSTVSATDTRPRIVLDHGRAWNTDEHGPDTYDPESKFYDVEKAWVQEVNGEPVRKYALPFEAIDTVIGIVLYDKHAFQGEFVNGWGRYPAVPTPNDKSIPLEDNKAKWVLEHGKTVFFNRYTGAIME